MKPSFFIVFVLLFTIASCDEEKTTETEGVHLRIKNNSSYTMTDIVVNEMNYGSLSAGKSSAYVKVEPIYRYGYIRLNAGGKECILQPIDYVGETKFENGKFTYVLSLGDLNASPYGAISLEFQEY